MPLFPPVTEDDSSAMGLVSTISDMAKLNVDLLQPVPQILGKSLVEELCVSQFPPDSPPAFGLGYAEVKLLQRLSSRC